MEDEHLGWACRCVPNGAVGQVTSTFSETSGCAGIYCVRFDTCTVVVAKSRCVSCAGTCSLAEAVGCKIVEALRGPAEQRVGLRAVGQVVAAALEGKESEDMAVAAVVFVATEPLTTGGASGAFVYCGRGPMAAFQADPQQRVFVEVVARTDRSPSSSSPAGSAPVSSTGSPTSTSPRAPLPADLLRTSAGPDEACVGACAPGQLFVLVAEPSSTGRQHGGSINKVSSGQISKTSVTGSMWKRASVAGAVSLVAETVRATAKTALADSADWSLQGPPLEQALIAGMRQRRPEAFVATICAPAARSSSGGGGGGVAALEGSLFGEHEHAPLGVLVLHAPGRGAVTLFVRTVPFGSLECTPSENHVSMYLSRREDQLGQSHMTKWDKNVRKTTDELAGSHFVRVVLLPCKVDPLSQSIKILENGIVRIDYQTREVQVTPQHHVQQPQGGTTPKRSIGSVKRSIFNKKKE